MAGMRKRAAAVSALLLLLLLGVSLAAGCGGEKVAVPNLVGMSAQEAKAALLECGLEMGEMGEDFSDASPPGSVIATAPEHGTEVSKGTRVDVVLSLGPETVTLPALLGLDEAQAAAALRELGFRVEVNRSYSEEVPEGCVCAMDPAPGSGAANGSKVTITVSQGSAYVACSACGGDGRMPREDACSSCGGDGYVDVAVNCPECGGSGECPT